METMDEMLLCLPYKYGGYGLKKPLMNTPINLQGRASIITGKSKCIADLCWPEAKLILEHQGSF